MYKIINMKPNELNNLSHDVVDLTTGKNSLSTDSDEKSPACLNDQSELILKLMKFVKDLERKLEYAESNLASEKEKNILLREKDELNRSLRASIELSSQNKAVIVNQLQRQISELHNSKSTMQHRIEELNLEVVKKEEFIAKLEIDMKEKNTHIAQQDSQKETISLYRDIFVKDMKTIFARFEPYFDGSDGWMLIQSRINGRLSFFRNSKDYLDGFLDISGEYWLGCKKLQILTNIQRHELYIKLQNIDDVWTYAKYDNFLIGSDSEVYEIQALGSYLGNGDDVFLSCWTQLLMWNYTDGNLNENDVPLISKLGIKSLKMFIRIKRE